MKKLKVLMVFDCPGVPEDYDFRAELKDENWATEASVKKALTALGHDVSLLGIGDDIDLLGKKISEFRPDLLFNLTEVFHGKAVFEKNLPSYFELQNVPYSGCSAAGLMLCRNKALSKKILKYHKIKVPEFQVFKKGGSRKPLAKLKIPLIIKPLQEQASIGIAQSSFVKNEASLHERVKFIHDNLNMDAIAEEYIEGRELYVGILGYKRLHVFPPREMVFTNVPDEDPKIATYKAKWDKGYRKKWGINNIFANEISEEILKKMFSICKRAYRALNIGGYCRLDIRLTPDNDIYIIEANANPALADSEDFALSAKKAGIPYELLIKKIINLAFNREI